MAGTEGQRFVDSIAAIVASLTDCAVAADMAATSDQPATVL